MREFISDRTTARTGSVPRVRQVFAPGGAAGDVAVPHVSPEDSLLSVYALSIDGGTSTITPADLTDEFEISAAGVLSNAGGTSTAGATLVVTFYDADLFADPT